MNLPSQACRTGDCWTRIMWFTLACSTFSSASTRSSFVLGVAPAPPTVRQTDARVRRPGQAIDSDCPPLSVADHGVARLLLARQRAERRRLLPNQARLILSVTAPALRRRRPVLRRGREQILSPCPG